MPLRGRFGGEPRPVRPVRTAALLALAYLVVCLAYIRISSAVAARMAGSVADLERIETLKGALFVVVSAAAFFAFAWFVLQRIASHERALADHRTALVAAERQAVAGVFAASVAHDINNVLTVMDAGVHLIAEDDLDGDQRGELERQLESAVADLAVLSRRLSEVGRRTPGAERSRLVLAEVADDGLRFARSHTRLRSCDVRLAADDPDVAVEGDAALLHQMILNLVLNAADATGNHGRVEVRVRRDAGGAVLEVHDDGPGIPPAQRAAVWEPFRTTKPEGSGLGLLSVRAGAEAHRAVVEVGDSPLGGACFRVRFPAVARANAPVAS